MARDKNNGGGVIETEKPFVLFPMQSDAQGPRLWRTDGTTSGTKQVSTVVTLGSNDNRTAEWMQVIGSKTYFVGCEDTYGCELWSSDGTAVGTTLVKDINPSGNSDPTHFTVVNGVLYFSARDGVHDRELWKSDGTSDGTVMVQDFNLSGNGVYDNQNSLVSFQGKIYFDGDDGNGEGLYQFDPSNDSFTLILSGFSEHFAVTSSKIFFMHYFDDGFTSGYEFWSSEGTVGTTSRVITGIEPWNIRAIDDSQVMFMGYDGIDYFLYVSDGTAPGTIPLKTTDGNVAGVSNNLYYFQGREADGLWVSDGTLAGTKLVKNENVGLTFSFDSKLFMLGNSDVSSAELWSTDGTTLGTNLVYANSIDSATMVKNMLEAQANACISIFGDLTPTGGELNCKADGLRDNGVGYSVQLYPPTIAGPGQRGTPGTDYGQWCYGGPRDCSGNTFPGHQTSTSFLRVDVNYDFCVAYNAKVGLGARVIPNCTDTAELITQGIAACTAGSSDIDFPDIESQSFCYHYGPDPDSFSISFDTTLPGIY